MSSPLYSQNSTPVPSEWEGDLVPEAVWNFWEKEKRPAPASIRKT